MARAVSTGSGVVLDLIRSGEATTRTDLVGRLGWARHTVSRRVDELLAARVIVSAGQADSRGGRPPEVFVLNKDAGLLLAIDVGGSHSRVGVFDLGGTMLLADEADIGQAEGPGEVFDWASQVLDHLLTRMGRGRSDVRAVGVGVPGPVDVRDGRLATPQKEAAWEGIRVRDHVPGGFDAIFAQDRDVNLLAVGESRVGWPELRHLVVVKIGIGVSCAFVLDGEVYRGARGGAGELSYPMGAPGSLRRLETVAGGGVIRAELRARGYPVRTSRDIVALADADNADARMLLEDTGRMIGGVLAEVVELLNPEAVVLTGYLVDAGAPLLDPLVDAISRGVRAFARQDLLCTPGRLGADAGLIGAALVAQDALLRADRISELTRSGAWRLDAPWPTARRRFGA